MSTKKLPLTVKIAGVKKTIGEAVVDEGDGYLDITAKVTDEEWIGKLTRGAFSISYDADVEGDFIPREAHFVPPRISVAAILKGTHPVPGKIE